MHKLQQKRKSGACMMSVCYFAIPQQQWFPMQFPSGISAATLVSITTPFLDMFF
jgi:hypothetical protein